MKNAPEVKYSIKELDDLVKRKGTCVTLQRKSRMLYLDPVQFSSTKSGFHAFLDVLLLKYDFIFKAIVLGYKKIKLLTECGLFCYRSSKISVLIEAEFYLFNPAIGSKLQGVVCKRSGQHIGCLVHKAFNVFIPLNQNNYKTGWDYAIGEEVEFEVVSMDLTTGPLPYIKGQLEREEKDSEEDESEGSVISAEDGGGHGNEWGRSDSGVASSPGRESDDSDSLETLESTEREDSTQEESIGSPKAVKKRKSILKKKKAALFSNIKGMNEDESDAVVSKIDDESIEMHKISKEVPINEVKAEDLTSLPSEKMFNENELKASETRGEVLENGDENVTKKVKRKSMSKKKRTSLLYESIAEQIQKTVGVASEENGETSGKEGLGNVNVASPRKPDTEHEKQSRVSGNMKENSTETVIRRSRRKKTDSPEKHEDLVKKLLKEMEMSIDEKDNGGAEKTRVEVNVETSLSDGIAAKSKDTKEQSPKTVLPANLGDISPKKATGKRKRISCKKDEVPLSIEEMIRRLSNVTHVPDVMPEIPAKEEIKDEQKTVIALPDGSIEKVKRRQSLDNTKKKSRRSVINLSPLTEEHKTPETEELFVKDGKTSITNSSAKEENGNQLKKPDILNGIESSGEAKEEAVIAQLEKSTEKGKGRHSLDNSKDRTKKKSRKSVINLLPVTEEYKSPITEELLVKYDKTSISITSDKEENGKELVKPNYLGSAESSIISQKRKRESLGEEKTKKRKSTSSVTPQAEKTEAEIQIERLLSLNKKLLGFDSVDISEKLSTEEKKSKKRKRGSVGVKESPKKKSR